MVLEGRTSWNDLSVTLTAAWVRKVGNAEELVFASDSRLRGGEAWNCCPKILTLPREDCAIAFAGNTRWAYPLMLQIAKAIELYPGSMDRKVDITDVRGHALRVFEQMLSIVDDLPRGQRLPDRPLDTEFLFGGYSWRTSEFKIWKLHFDTSIDRYTFRPSKPWPGQEKDTVKVVAFGGDTAPMARVRLTSLLKQRGKMSAGSLDMEPFEVLRDMIRSGEFPTVGGPPQVAKIYKFARTQTFGVAWPDSSGQVTVGGRPALDYEVFAAPVIDPDRPHLFGRSRYEEEESAGNES